MQTESNYLLASLREDDRSRLRPLLRPVSLRLRQEVETIGQPVQQVYFPTSALVAMNARVGMDEVQVGVVARAGATGWSAFLDGHVSGNRGVVQIAGDAFAVSVVDLKPLLEARPSMRS